MVPPSSPASRPSPPGGLRPTLTPTADGAVQQQSGAGRFKINPTKSSLYGFRGLPGAHDAGCRWPSSWGAPSSRGSLPQPTYVSFGRSAYVAACVERQQAAPHDDQGVPMSLAGTRPQLNPVYVERSMSARPNQQRAVMSPPHQSCDRCRPGCRPSTSQSTIWPRIYGI
jgi:hypothetical protein